MAHESKLVTAAHELNRLYSFEPVLSVTGANADHRLPMKASQIQGFASALAAAVGVAGTSGAVAEGMNRAARA